MQVDESELIAQVITGDADAYGQLVDRYKNAVYYHCYAIVRDEDVAEDVAQETFIAAYYKINSFDRSKKLSTWLFKIATNKALNIIRSRKHFTTEGDDILKGVVSAQRTPEELARDNDIHQAVDNLIPKQRAVVSLYYWQGLSYEEVAEVLSVPVGSVKGWMSRAKAALRKELV